MIIDELREALRNAYQEDQQEENWSNKKLT
jgi:hypothetical protein